MKIVIAGAGVVGESLCSELSAEGNDVILIEKEEKVLNKLVETYDNWACRKRRVLRDFT